MTAFRRPRDIDFCNSVDDLMREWPRTIRVFLEFRMNCVGCPIGTFHTIEDSCREHDVDLDRFVAELRRAVR